MKLSHLSKLSIAVIASMYSFQALAESDIPSISVQATELSDVSGEQIKSADLADALTRNVPNISLIRRSGIANDIILRGQNKDNINILIDNAKVYGACPNRMDPPTSHVLTNNIESIEIIEGPYDVENFGTLSGVVKVKTKKPEEDLHGEISVNFGSWNYQKQAMTLTGGNEKVRGLVSVSKESSEQYEDGDGNDFAEQIDELNPSFTPMAGDPHYKDIYRGMDAYDKKTFMSKFYFNLIDNHEMAVSYTANRSDDVLYPSSKMDALYDDSNILNLDYSITNLGELSKKLDFQYYHSDVTHPMSTKYRIASSAPQTSSTTNSNNEVVSKLTTDMDGFKVKNAFDIDSTFEGSIGLDYSKRNWDGKYIGYGMKSGITDRKSIDDVDTDNTAIFAELEKRYSNFTVKVGARYDDVSINPDGTQQDNDYDYFSGFINGTYTVNNTTSLFGGLGKSSRVPDARELYWKMSSGMEVGTPDLDKTDNYEIDFGIENNFENLTIKTKFFHSWLKDYIHYNDSKTMNRQENVDAKIYGFDVSGMYSFTDEIYLDFGVAYQRGKKDKALTGQTDKDLANITPAKLNLGLNYDYMANGTAKVEVIAADTWDNYDEDNGEQKIDSYAIMNLKARHNLTKNFEVTVGVDNVFDKTYAINNTYKDLILLGDASGDVMMMNEPGRYYYLNAAFRF
ncbi:MAG: TonB-dependent receptor [Gammaproteobacteria bacterium]|nr:TonB-dependent receptor [Gammaproteobacteria bacterium]